MRDGTRRRQHRENDNAGAERRLRVNPQAVVSQQLGAAPGNPTSNVISADCRGGVNGRQYKRRVARELAARDRELEPEEHPEEQEVSSVTQLAPEQQRQPDDEADQREQRQLDGKEYEIEIPGYAVQP